MSHLREVPPDAKTAAIFDAIRSTFGFVPNFFRAQTMRPDFIETEVPLVDAILLKEGALTRQEKEYIFLVCSGANLSTYCVTAHCEIVRMLGIQGPEPEQVALDHGSTTLPAPLKALLDFALKLNNHPTRVARQDIDSLRAQGFSDQQIMEAVVVLGLAKFANFVAFGLGTAPDFDSSKVRLGKAESTGQPGASTMDIDPARIFPPEEANLFEAAARPMAGPETPVPRMGPGEDADAALVASVRSGDLDAFEELVRRHNGRIYRTLIGILGDAEEAKDAMQDTFLKAFQHLREFEGRSKFSTWLARIACNGAMERLRGRKHVESLDDGFETEEGFRPRELQAWHDNPEQLFSEAEVRELMEKGLTQLPAKYRVVVMLRDIEELSTEEAAATLGLGIPALKSRLVRGRLMLREALSPYFAKGEKRRTA